MKVNFFVAASSPYNSIRLQIDNISNILQVLFNVEIVIIHPGINNFRHKIKNAILRKEIVFWHYGGFDEYLNSFIRDKNIIYVYHNITPSKYFWNTEPLVAIRSIIGKLQMKFIPKNNLWITMSRYNKNELTKFSFNNIVVCPNIVTSGCEFYVSKNKEITLLFVGRIAQNKNCILLLEQIKKVAVELKKTVNLTIVGAVKPKSRYGIRFINQFKKNQHHEYFKINWISNVNDEELKILYKESWLYVSMSLHEGFGLPACESIMNGTPALYLECGGQESVLKNIGMVSIADQNNFYKYVIDLIVNEKCRKKLLQNQFDIVNNYSSPKIDKVIYDIYKPILNS